MTEPDNKQWRVNSDVFSTWEWAISDLYDKFYSIMERHNATAEEMHHAIGRYCDWETADGFREWINEE